MQKEEQKSSVIKIKGKIAAVVVTYNRLELLKQCITSLRVQTYKLDEIVVINNSSTDGTEKWLEEQKDLKYINQENSGSAGGQYTGIKETYRKGFDWIWCIDCDIIFEPDALKNLMSCEEINDQKIGFLSSFIFFDNTNVSYVNIPELGYPYDLLNSIYQNKPIPILSASFGSLLIPKEIISAVGLPIKDFFIWGDDAEFTLRIISKGYKGYLVKDSLAQHKTVSNSKEPYNELSHKDLKFKFGIRNMVYVSILRNKITHNSKIRGILSGLGFVIRILKNRGKNISLIFICNVIFLFLKGIFLKPKIDIPE